MVSGRSLGFLVTVAIASFLILALGAVNAWYFKRARDGTCAGISSKTALTLMILNILQAVVALIVFIWTLFQIFVPPKVKTALGAAASATAEAGKQAAGAVYGAGKGAVQGVAALGAKTPDEIWTPVIPNVPPNVVPLK